MSTPNLNVHVCQFLDRWKTRLVQDLNAIPEDKLNEGLGANSRTALNIAAECGAINQVWIGFFETGFVTFMATEDEPAFYAKYNTRKLVLGLIEETCLRLTELFMALDPAKFAETTDAFRGRTMTYLQLAEFPTVHMCYHDGQLNYIQTLLGDDAIHWGV
ncbi:MAG: DinB family protein [Chthonomonadales bacterium]